MLVPISQVHREDPPSRLTWICHAVLVFSDSTEKLGCEGSYGQSGGQGLAGFLLSQIGFSKTSMCLLLLGARSEGLYLPVGPWWPVHCHPRGLLRERLQPAGEWWHGQCRTYPALCPSLSSAHLKWKLTNVVLLIYPSCATEKCVWLPEWRISNQKAL